MGPAGVRVWRIQGRRHPVFSGEGARLFGGRWNSPGRPVIYCGSSYALCMLERLVHAAGGGLPKGDRFVAVDLPDDAVEHLDETALGDWAGEDLSACRAAGDAWLMAGRSLALSVPSAVTRVDRNVLVNPLHPAFAALPAPAEQPVVWDRRLFGR